MMAPPLKYESPRVLFNKLKQQAAYLEEEVSWDRFNDFVIPAFHLCDWVIEDVASTSDVLKDVKRIKNSLEIQACRDRVNAHKHRRITRYRPKTNDTSVQEGFGRGRYGKGGFGIGEEQITLVMNDGTVYDGLDLARRVVNLWSGFFAQHPELLSI